MNVNIKNISATHAVIEIQGTIGLPEEWQYASDDSTESVSTYEKFRGQLSRIVDEGARSIRVNIRSTGGSVQDAILIHGALCELEGVSIETHCYGFVASAATIIAQAASQGARFVASSALYLIHNASAQIEGNSKDVEAISVLLEKTDSQIAQIYATRSGLEVDYFRQIMARDSGKGEWLSPEEVVEIGLADRVERISPIKNGVERVKNFLRKLIDAEEVYSSDSDQLTAMADLTFEPLGALATQTMPKEDPVVENPSVRLTGNRNAYMKDAELFRG